MAPPESRIDPHGVKLGDAGFQAQIAAAKTGAPSLKSSERSALSQLLIAAVPISSPISVCLPQCV